LPARAKPRRDGQLELFATVRRSLRLARGNGWTRQWLLFGRRPIGGSRTPNERRGGLCSAWRPGHCPSRCGTRCGYCVVSESSVLANVRRDTTDDRPSCVLDRSTNPATLRACGVRIGAWLGFFADGPNAGREGRRLGRLTYS
jgi:hypothetical protein